jgi:hypothetical protein
MGHTLVVVKISSVLLRGSSVGSAAGSGEGRQILNTSSAVAARYEHQSRFARRSFRVHGGKRMTLHHGRRKFLARFGC